MGTIGIEWVAFVAVLALLVVSASSMGALLFVFIVSHRAQCQTMAQADESRRGYRRLVNSMATKILATERPAEYQAFASMGQTEPPEDGPIEDHAERESPKMRALRRQNSLLRNTLEELGGGSEGKVPSQYRDITMSSDVDDGAI